MLTKAQTKELRDGIEALLGQSGRLLALLPPEQWRGWACYFLESLEAHAGGGDMRPCLEGLQADIETRLEAAKW